MKTLLNIFVNPQPQVVIDQDPDTIKANFVFMWCENIINNSTQLVERLTGFFVLYRVYWWTGYHLSLSRISREIETLIDRKFEMLGSPVPRLVWDQENFAGSNPAISTKINKKIMTTFTQYQQQQQINRTDW